MAPRFRGCGNRVSTNECNPRCYRHSQLGVVSHAFLILYDSISITCYNNKKDDLRECWKVEGLLNQFILL